MAKLKKKRPQPSARSRVASVKSLRLATLIEGPRPTDPESDALWLALRSEIDRAAHMGPFDPRTRPQEDDLAIARWREKRAAWIAEMFRNDTRVIVPARG